MSTQDTEDRREYYRIDDQIALQIRLPGSQKEEDSLLFSLLGDLHLLEYEAQPLLRSVSESDRALSSYLKMINKRIDLLGQVLAHNLLEAIGPPRQVSLSESSLAFIDETTYPLGTLLSLKIVLLPQGFGLHVDARVIEHRDTASGRQTVTVFENLSDATRQILARHILHKQALQRRLALQPSHSE
ncbi:MAG: PilZ domain-containing protein [Gammaproteobacteria bacterium]|nr:PilZ domain-containing protein [Gammaproteobacteria bacterium]